MQRSINEMTKIIKEKHGQWKKQYNDLVSVKTGRSVPGQFPWWCRGILAEVTNCPESEMGPSGNGYQITLHYPGKSVLVRVDDKGVYIDGFTTWAW